VFEAIKAAQPQQLFIAADGPRAHRPEDAHLCEETRAIVSRIDWECDVHTLFRDVNLGCRLAILEAIDWFFEYVEDGVILEDDCLPSPSFFAFCGELLDRYRDDSRVMQINGNFYLDGLKGFDSSYYFSKLSACWGWATWKRAWRFNDPDMSGYKELRGAGGCRRYYESRQIGSWMQSYFDEAIRPACGIWSTVWAYAIMKNNGLCINPTVNLVQNIGIDETATSGSIAYFQRYSVYTADDIKAIQHPNHVACDCVADALYFDAVVKKTDPRFSVRWRLRQLFHKFLPMTVLRWGRAFIKRLK